MNDNQKKRGKWYIILFRICCIFAIMAFLFVLFVAKIEEISSYIEKKKEQFFAICWNPTDVDFSQYDPLVDEEGAWYSDNRIIAHACGAISGKTYTNSKEALELALQNGYQLIEADFLLTSDNRVILRHAWDQYLEQGNINKNNIPDFDTFMDTRINYKYHALSFLDMLEMLDTHEDTYVVVDVKGENEEILPVYQKMVEEAEGAGKEYLLNRLIIQIYDEENYNQVKGVYPFSNWLYTLYKSGNRDLNGVAQFCIENDIHVVTMPVGWIKKGEYLSVFQNMNIKVYTNTVNSIDDWKKYQGRNVYGIYSDFLIPTDYEFVKE